MGTIPCCLSNAYTIGLGHMEHISPPSFLWCPVSSVRGPGVHSPIIGLYDSPRRAYAPKAQTRGNACILRVCPLPTGPKAARIPGTCARHPSAHPIGSPVLTNVVITTKGADDDVADSSTGTNKGNPTVTAIFASPADSESGDSARNSHPCGCRHSC